MINLGKMQRILHRGQSTPPAEDVVTRARRQITKETDTELVNRIEITLYDNYDLQQRGQLAIGYSYREMQNDRILSSCFHELVEVRQRPDLWEQANVAARARAGLPKKSTHTTT